MQSYFPRVSGGVALLAALVCLPGISECGFPDADGDTYTSDVDCNDEDATVNPGATEICNSVDDNCNGHVDEGVSYTRYQDLDGDGFGPVNTKFQSCSMTGSGVDLGYDCNDANPTVHPVLVDVSYVGIETGTVTEPFNSIREGANRADGKETYCNMVLAKKGTYKEGVLLLDGYDLSIVSVDGPAQTIFDGQENVLLQLGSGWETSLTFEGFSFINGSGLDGAVYIGNNMSIMFRNCVFSGLNSLQKAGVYIFGSATKVRMENVLMVQNESNYGGAIYVNYGANIEMSFVTAVGNTAALSGASVIYADSTSGVHIQNSIIAFNTGDVPIDAKGVLDIQYSDLYNNFSSPLRLEGEGNLEVDPLFFLASPELDWYQNDLHLQGGSLCIDAGDPNIQDPNGTRADMGYYGGPNAQP